MANRTVKDAHSVKGTNPQYLIEKITRSRIYESRYWKEQCFALTAELLVDKAMELRYVGGIFGGNIKPTPFLCLILKMLQIQPEKDIVVEFISQQDCKYVRALGAMYMRLTGSSLDCYKYLEPLYLDYRKLRKMNKIGGFELIHMDEFIDEIIREDRVCDVILPRIQKRHVLEEQNDLAPKDNYLEDDMDDVESSSDEEEGEYRGIRNRSTSPGRTRDWDKPRRSPSPRYRRSRSRSPHRRRERDDRHRSDRDRDRGDDRRGDRRDDRRDRDRKHRESDREHKSGGRDRDRHRDKESSSSKKDKHRSHRHDDDDERSRHHHKSKKSKRDKDEKKSKTGSSSSANVDAEIAEANALRAQLGLPPLK